jgi:uncharacterized protein
MIQKSKVLGFLDLAGPWDPSLAFVMAGAISIGVVGFFIAGKAKTTLLGKLPDIPTRRDIDWQLLIGSLIFGVGWGLAGICPGPAIAVLAFGSFKAIIFVVAILAGMLIFELTGQLRETPRQNQPVEDC